MVRFGAVVVCVSSLIACSGPARPDAGDDGGTSQSSSSSGIDVDAGSSCGPIVETRLPAAGEGDVVILCNACDNSCPLNAEPCGTYGATRANGSGGADVCVSCCNGSNGTLYWEADAGQDLLPWGASCDAPSQCKSGSCIPAPNSFGAGACYGADMVGCIKVGIPSPSLEACPGGKVYVCGDDWPMSSMGECSEVFVGNVGESYQCCYGSGLITRPAPE